MIGRSLISDIASITPRVKSFGTVLMSGASLA